MLLFGKTLHLTTHRIQNTISILAWHNFTKNMSYLQNNLYIVRQRLEEWHTRLFNDKMRKWFYEMTWHFHINKICSSPLQSDMTLVLKLVQNVVAAWKSFVWHCHALSDTVFWLLLSNVILKIALNLDFVIYSCTNSFTKKSEVRNVSRSLWCCHGILGFNSTETGRSECFFTSIGAFLWQWCLWQLHVRT